MIASDACDECLARAWLLARLSGHLDQVRDRTLELLGLPDRELIAALAGQARAEVEREYERFSPRQARKAGERADIHQVCRCASGYPEALGDLAAPPAVLHVRQRGELPGRLIGAPPVAIVGARRASPYGLDMAHALGRGLATAGITVVSGLAVGIDNAAHQGALAAGGQTVAVLPGGADRPYPASARALHLRISEAGTVVSELPPGTLTRRWMFPARNRIIAGLAVMTVVVEARDGSGALITADVARRLERPVGAVPGRVTSPLAHGPHELLSDGARLVAGPRDVFETLFELGARFTPTSTTREPLPKHLERLLGALAEGHDTQAALVAAELPADRGLAALSELELAGRIRRGAGGRFAVLPDRG
jgi:DNA processing protein